MEGSLCFESSSEMEAVLVILLRYVFGRTVESHRASLGHLEMLFELLSSFPPFYICIVVSEVFEGHQSVEVVISMIQHFKYWEWWFGLIEVENWKLAMDSGFI